MLNILVIGSMEPGDTRCLEFLDCLAGEIVAHGHRFLNGARNQLDQELAKSIHKGLVDKGLDPHQYIVSYVSPDREPVHQYGKIFKSRVASWTSLATAGLDVPETIEQADVVLVINGREGTKSAANWARIARKPLLPLTNFGGAAKDIYDEELDQFELRNRTRLKKEEFENLNQYSNDPSGIAKDAMSLAVRAIISRDVFVIMSFDESEKWNDVYDSYKTVCDEFKFNCIKVDESNVLDRIIPEIFSGIERSAFVIADVSELRPNVFYELGYAHGLKKDIIVTAEAGTELPFDLADVPTIFWEGQKQLKDKLRDKIQHIAKRHGL